MSRQALIGFIIINIIVSILVVILVVTLLPDDEAQPRAINNQEADNNNNSSIIVVVTASPPVGAIADDLLYGTIGALDRDNRALRQTVTAIGLEVSTIQQPTQPIFTPEGIANVPPLDPSKLPSADLLIPNNATVAVDGVAAVPTVDDGCERYVVVSGDTCGGIAQRFTINLEELLELNNINAQCSNLQVGQELRIPSDFCKPPPTPQPTPTITRTPFDISIPATFAITNTAQPTAVDANVRITIIRSYGDITNEHVEIQNQGNTVNLLGWTLVDAQGNTFTFTDIRLLPGGIIRVFTRSNPSTEAALYWNLNAAIWLNGETATLYNAEGEVQSTYIVGETSVP